MTKTTTNAAWQKQQQTATQNQQQSVWQKHQ